MKQVKIILLFTLLFSFLDIFAQGGTGTHVQPLPYREVHIRNDVPMPYHYVREADVMWSKIIWRKIELSEKMNHVLALPERPIRGTKSLIDVILEGIHTQGLTAYKAEASDAGNEFSVIMTEDEIHTAMGAGVQYVVVPGIEGYDTVEVEIPYISSDISSYLVKEVWFFDRQRSVLDVRIIGMCPVRAVFNQNNNAQEYLKTFWIYYPEARPLLAKSKIYSPFTDVTNISYDDIFQKRFFSGYIFMESNPYERAILDYETGLEVLLEADRIKQNIFNFEQDLWEY